MKKARGEIKRNPSFGDNASTRAVCDTLGLMPYRHHLDDYYNSSFLYKVYKLPILFSFPTALDRIVL